jgi:hypothetical protein
MSTQLFDYCDLPYSFAQESKMELDFHSFIDG